MLQLQEGCISTQRATHVMNEDLLWVESTWSRLPWFKSVSRITMNFSPQNIVMGRHVLAVIKQSVDPLSMECTLCVYPHWYKTNVSAAWHAALLASSRKNLCKSIATTPRLLLCPWVTDHEQNLCMRLGVVNAGKGGQCSCILLCLTRVCKGGKERYP